MDSGPSTHSFGLSSYTVVFMRLLCFSQTPFDQGTFLLTILGWIPMLIGFCLNSSLKFKTSTIFSTFFLASPILFNINSSFQPDCLLSFLLLFWTCEKPPTYLHSSHSLYPLWQSSYIAISHGPLSQQWPHFYSHCTVHMVTCLLFINLNCYFSLLFLSLLCAYVLIPQLDCILFEKDSSVHFGVGRFGKTICFEAILPGFKSRLHHLQVLCPWASS